MGIKRWIRSYDNVWCATSDLDGHIDSLLIIFHDCSDWLLYWRRTYYHLIMHMNILICSGCQTLLWIMPIANSSNEWVMLMKNSSDEWIIPIGNSSRKWIPSTENDSDEWNILMKNNFGEWINSMEIIMSDAWTHMSPMDLVLLGNKCIDRQNMHNSVCICITLYCSHHYSLTFLSELVHGQWRR